MLAPRLLITLGDVAGIGPEIVAKAWPKLIELCRPIVVGDAGWLRRSRNWPGFRARSSPFRSRKMPIQVPTFFPVCKVARRISTASRRVK